MQLARHGLKLVTPEIAVTALSPDGRALVLYNDATRAAQEIGKFSAKDAERYPVFQQSLEKIGRVIGDALKLTPPNIDDPSRGDLWAMLQTGRALRKLGKKDMYRLLRWGPMAVADLVAEFFETELCAPPLPRAASLGPLWAHGRRAAVWCCSFALPAIHIRRARRSSRSAAPVRLRRPCLLRPKKQARRFARRRK